MKALDFPLKRRGLGRAALFRRRLDVSFLRAMP
jgi:hypothetical protein